MPELRCRPTRRGSSLCSPVPPAASRSWARPASSSWSAIPTPMTPDSNPLVGPVPGVPGLYLAAGLSLNGFGGGGGIGRSLAELDHHGMLGARPLSLPAVALRSGAPRPPLCGRAGSRGLQVLLLSPLPLRLRRVGPSRRTSALHARMQDLGAVFGAKHGWERPDYFEPGLAASRRRGPARVRVHAAALLRPARRGAPRVSRARRDHRHELRQDRVQRPGALPLLERVAGNLIDRPTAPSSTRSCSNATAGSPPT